jgi:N-acetylglucosaminyldiphosphoundecaprenol N-acetyl-beta-D-mannosaminyltransferase
MVALKKGRVIGLPVTVGNIEAVVERIEKTAFANTGGYVCVANVHQITTARRDPLLREVMENASMVTSDGMPLVWSLRRQGHQDAERVVGPELTFKLCEAAEQKEIPLYFYGGNPEAVKKLQKALNKRFPELKLAGCESPPMLPEHPPVDMEVVKRISSSGAKIVFVGLGCPKQEFWMAAYSSHLPAVLIGVGAAFNWISGTVPRAPLWMQHIGLEWLFRLFAEPRRLWKRYLVTNTLFIYYSFKDRFFSGH